jgi:hypothetical protein
VKKFNWKIEKRIWKTENGRSNLVANAYQFPFSNSPGICAEIPAYLRGRERLCRACLAPGGGAPYTGRRFTAPQKIFRRAGEMKLWLRSPSKMN